MIEALIEDMINVLKRRLKIKKSSLAEVNFLSVSIATEKKHPALVKLPRRELSKSPTIYHLIKKWVETLKVPKI